MSRRGEGEGVYRAITINGVFKPPVAFAVFRKGLVKVDGTFA
jgi:hypothetical protein